MIVSCTKCSTKYKLNLSSMGENGQKVRCTKCGHVWIHSNNKVDHGTKEGGIKVDISRNLPVVIEYVIPGWFKAIPVVFFILIVITLTFFFQEGFSDRSKTWRSFYNAVGFPYNRSLVIEKFDVRMGEDNDCDINAALVNQSTETRKLPSLVLRAIDSRNQNIGNFYIDPSVKKIGSGQEYNFSKRIKNLPENTKLIVAELQDKFDWISRY